MAKYPDWTKAEDEQLRTLVANTNNRDIAKLLGRSYHAVIARNIKLGLVAHRRKAILWTPLQLATLRDGLAEGASSAEIARRIGRSLKSIYSKMYGIERIRIIRAHWTEADLQNLRENAPTMPASKLATLLGRTCRGIRIKARELGLRIAPDPAAHPRWTEAQVDLLRAEAGSGNGATAIARMVDKSKTSVYRRARQAGIVIVSEHWWTPEQCETLRACAETMTARQAAQAMDHSLDAVRWKADRLGFTFKVDVTEPVKSFASPFFWTVEEMQLLRELGPTHTFRELSERMQNRTHRAIERKMQQMKITAKRAQSRRLSSSGSLTGKPRQARVRPAETKPRMVSLRPEVARVAYCGVCCAPVTNTYQGWSAHNSRVGCDRKAKRA
jgi:DNA-binding CsgD family transcriptional regulator